MLIISPQGTIIGTLVTGGTLGSVLFVGSNTLLAQNNSQLFWDNTNNRLGVGTATPTAKLDVKGSGTGEVLFGELVGSNQYAAIGLANSLSSSNFNFVSGPTDTTLYINRPTGSAIRFRENNGTDQVTILNGGNVGIGVATITAILHIAASVAANASLRIPAGTSPTTPNEGDIWNDSTQKAIIHFVDGLKQPAEGTPFTSTANASVTNTLTETTIIGTGIGTLTLPANFLVAGKTIRLTLYGTIASTVTPTLNIKAKLGSTVIASTTAAALVAITGTNMFKVETNITCRTTGAAGTVFGQGIFTYFSGLTGFNAENMVNTATVTVDTTVTQTIDVTATWGTADLANSIIGTNFSYEILN